MRVFVRPVGYVFHFTSQYILIHSVDLGVKKPNRHFIIDLWSGFFRVFQNLCVKKKEFYFDE